MNHRPVAVLDRAIGLYLYAQGIAHRRRFRIVAHDILRAVGCSDEGTALEVVLRDVDLVAGERLDAVARFSRGEPG